MYRLDKTAFNARSHEDTSSDFQYWTSKTLGERLRAAAYLNSVAFNYDFNNPPRMDKTVFKCRKRIKK